MKVRCKKCEKWFDDFYRQTICPHERFEPSQSAKDLLAKLGNKYEKANPDFEPFLDD